MAIGRLWKRGGVCGKPRRQRKTLVVRERSFNFREASRQSCGALEFFFSASAVQGGTTPTERE